MKIVFWIVVYLLILAAAAAAQPPGAECDECSGFIYRTKRDGVVVYESADRSSRVVGQLASNAPVCVVGKEKDLVIIDRRALRLSAQDPGEKEALPLAYGSEFDFWAPPEAGPHRERTLVQRVRAYYQFIKSGGVPEDPLLPYRPILNLFSTERAAPKKACRSPNEAPAADDQPERLK